MVMLMMMMMMMMCYIASESESTSRSSSPLYSAAGSLPVTMTTPEAKRLRSCLPPQPKKKYQKAGLFSSCYKHDESVPAASFLLIYVAFLHQKPTFYN